MVSTAQVSDMHRIQCAHCLSWSEAFEGLFVCTCGETMEVVDLPDEMCVNMAEAVQYTCNTLLSRMLNTVDGRPALKGEAFKFLCTQLMSFGVGSMAVAVLSEEQAREIALGVVDDFRARLSVALQSGK